MAFQSALVTGRGGFERTAIQRVDEPPAADERTDLKRLVAAVAAAHRANDAPTPSPPWCEPLGDEIARSDAPLTLCPHDWCVVDDPDRQRQFADGWGPSDGHLVVVGGPGSGTTTSLAAAVLAVTSRSDDAVVHVHIVDLDRGDLLALGDLGAVGSVVGPSEGRRRRRILRWLDDEIARRRADPSVERPSQLLVVDDLAGMARAHDPVREPEIHEQFVRIWSDGPAVGVVVAVSLGRAADLPSSLAGSVGEVLLHHTTEAGDGLRFGLPADAGAVTDTPGRAMRSSDGLLLQVVRPEALHAEVAIRSAWPLPTPAPHDVGELAEVIAWDACPGVVEWHRNGDVEIGIAVADADLQRTAMRLHAGEHAMVFGPARSGRSSVLAAIARAAGDHAFVVTDVDRSPLGFGQPVRPDAVGRLAGPALLLLDDVLTIDDPVGELAAVIAAPPSGVHIIATTRPDRFRAAYSHWSHELRFARQGLLLQPEPIDGDLLGVALPARLVRSARPGEGLLVGDGQAASVQVILADDQSSAG